MSQAAWFAVSTAFFTAGLLLIVLLERLRPYDKWRAFLRRGFWTDLIGYAGVRSYVLALAMHPAVLPLKSALSAVWGLWIHANVDVHTGRWQWLINGPEAHRWHHASDADAHNHNFATKLALWDRLFGTAWLPVARKPDGYGLGYDDFPEGYLRQQIFAFRAMRR